jgi:hypothetical protein
VAALAKLRDLSLVCCRVRPAALENAVLPVVAALTCLTRLKLLNQPAQVKQQGELFLLPDLMARLSVAPLAVGPAVAMDMD